MTDAIVARRNILRTCFLVSGAGLFKASLEAQTAAAAGIKPADLPSTDVEGHAQLCRELSVPVIVGEFLFSLYDYPEYIRREAADTLRFVVDNVGGITPGVKIGILAECHGMEVMPHGVENVLHQAAHLHCELATPNSAFVEVPYPQGARDAQPYMNDLIRISPDGCVHAPSKPGLGYEIDRAALDRAITQIER